LPKRPFPGYHDGSSTGLLKKAVCVIIAPLRFALGSALPAEGTVVSIADLLPVVLLIGLLVGG
jgi:hypothetical protein